MGCDIHGFVEIVKYPRSSPDWWTSVVEIDSLVGRNYGMFGLLFNQRNNDNYKPTQEYPKGLPDYGTSKDESTTYKESERWGEDAHSHTWISYKDLKENTDWNQVVTSNYICYYESQTDGTLLYKGGFMSSSELTDDEHQRIRQGEEIRKIAQFRDDKPEFVYKLGTSKVKDSISSDWQTLFDMMELLAKHVGKENVRLVVWFDN